MIIITDPDKNFGERILTNQKLKELEENVINIFESSPNLYFLVDNKERLLDFKGNEDLLYLTPEMFLGKTIYDVLPKNVAQKFDNAIKETYKTKNPTKIVYSLPINDNYHYFEAINLYISEDRVAIHVKDITEQKKTKQNLTAILDHTHMLVAYLDSQFNFIRVNRAYAKADDKNESFFLGKNHFELYPNKENEEIFQKVVETGKPYYAYGKPFEYVEHPERGITYWDWSLIPIKSDTEEVEGLVFTLQNVTAKKSAELGMKKSEELFRKLFEMITEGVILTNIDGQIIQANPAAEKILGLKRSAIEKRNFLSPEWEILHPDGSLMPSSEMAGPRAMQEKKVVKNIVMGVRCPDNTVSWINVSAVPLFDEKNELSGIVGTFSDITKQKKAQEELLNEKKFTEAALNTQRDTFFIFDPLTSKAIRWNKAFSEITGYTDEEIVNLKAPESYYTEQDLETAAKAIEQIDKEGKALLEMNLITKDGISIPFEYLGTGINDEEGNLKYIVSIGRDVTDRKKAEQKLRESEEKFRKITEQSLMGIIILQDNKIKYVNSAAAKMLGYTVEEILNIPAGGFINLVHPNYRNLVIGQAKKRQNGIKTNITGYEHRVFKKNGDTIWIQNFSKTIVYEGKFADLITVIDVSDQKKAEEKLRASKNRFRGIFDNASHGIALIDPNGKFITFNEKAATMLGYTKEEFINKTPMSVTHPDDLKSSQESLKMLLDGEIDSYRFEKRYITKDNKEFWVDLSVRALYDDTGSINAILGILVDINDRKEAELRFKESEKKLKDERDNLINMLNSMEDGVYIVNEHYDIEFVNPSLQSEFGQVGDKKCYEYFQNLSEPCQWCKTQKKITQGSIIWEWDSPVTKKFYEIIATPIKRVDGTISKLVMFHDITERRKATEKLKKARERADMYLNLAGVILVALDRDGIITLLNKKGHDILGWNEGELIGKNWFENCLPSEDRNIVYDYFKNLMKGKTDVVPFYENQVISKNGEKKIITWSTILFRDSNGKINGLLSSGEDITERKKAENELKRLSKLKSELLTRTSHELKTPAMHIKGYADLLLHKYKKNLGIDELQIISHIKKGVLRLETLIYDIMHKAELDSSESELKIVRGNLSSLIELSVKELRSFAALRGHSIRLNIDDNMIINFDKEQIRHVLNNLITNAIKYTPLNGIIGINSTITDNFLTIAIQDNGIGLTEEQISRLFTQFGKIERYGQGFDIITEGSGLGLHITKKIIDLHGGKIWVESGGINKGSTFYFSLPRTYN